MANVVLKDPREYKIIPTHHIRIGIAGGGDYYYNLEDGSSWTLAPILRKTDRGGDRIVGFIFTGTFIVLQNNYQDNNAGFTNIIANQPTDFDMWLYPGYATPWQTEEDWNSQDNGAHIHFTADDVLLAGTMNVKDWHANFSINESKESPRLTINIQGYFSNDLFTKCNVFSET